MTVSLKPVSHGSGRQSDGAIELDGLGDLTLRVQDETLAVDDFEGDLVDVHRVGIGSGVVDLPDLGRADGRVLGHRVHPLALRPHTGGHGAEERLDGALDLLPFLVGALACFLDQRQLPRDHRRRQRRDRRQLEELRRGRVVDAERRHDAELEDLAGRPRVGHVEVVAGSPSAERLVGADVARGHGSPRGRS